MPPLAEAPLSGDPPPGGGDADVIDAFPARDHDQLAGLGNLGGLGSAGTLGRLGTADWHEKTEQGAKSEQDEPPSPVELEGCLESPRGPLDQVRYEISGGRREVRGSNAIAAGPFDVIGSKGPGVHRTGTEAGSFIGREVCDIIASEECDLTGGEDPSRAESTVGAEEGAALINEKLSDEIFMSIISCLDTADRINFTLVCRRFKAVERAARERLVVVNKWAKSVGFVTGDGRLDRRLVQMARDCTGLRAVELERCVLGESGLAAFIEHCQLLRKFSLNFSRLQCPLSSLSSFTFLSELTLSGQNALDSALPVSDDIAAGCLRHLHKLVIRFWLAVLPSPKPSLGPGDPVLQAFARGCPRLRRLHLFTCCNGVTSAGLKLFAHYRPGLEELVIDDCTGRGSWDRGVSAVVAASPSLKVFRCQQTWISESALLEVVQRCKQLEHLGIEIEGVYSDHQVALHEVARLSEVELGQAMSQLTSLRKVDFAQGGTKLGDSAMERVAAACPRLTHVRLFRCLGVGDVGVLALLRGCKGLVSLAIGFCPKVTPWGVQGVVNGGHALKELLVEKSKVSAECAEVAASLGITIRTESSDQVRPLF